MYLVTGAAGFIGFHLTKRLLGLGCTVVGVDNLNDYYEVTLKEERLRMLASEQFIFYKVDLADRKELDAIFIRHQVTHVINLAAQAG